MFLEEEKIYSNKEMAEWFQVSLGTFKNTKKKKLEYLKFFAEFVEEKHKIRIIKVYQSNYINPRDREQNDRLYKKAIAEVIVKQPLQLFITCAGRVMQLKDKDLEKLQHKSTTMYQYVRRNLKELADGSHREWCQRFYNSDIDFIPLNDEQFKFWKTILDRFLGTEKSELIAEIKSQQDQGELTKEEANNQISDINTYQWIKAKDAFLKKYGFEPVSVSRWEINAIILKMLEKDNNS